MTTDPGAQDSTGDRGSRPSRRDLVWLVARITLVAAWVVWAGSSWWCAPRAADANQLLKDAAAGRVTSVDRIDGWISSGFPGWGTPPEPRHQQGAGEIAWSTASGQVHYTGGSASLGNVEVPAAPRSDQGEADLLDGLQRVATKSVADPTRAKELDLGPFARVAGRVGEVLVGLTFLLVVLGPAPRRGNRWYWFWVTQIPLGLGMLLWLWREHPWSRGVPEPDPFARSGPDAGPGPEGRPPRRRDDDRESGFTGFAMMLASSIVVALALWGARSVLGPWIVPG